MRCARRSSARIPTGSSWSATRRSPGSRARRCSASSAAYGGAGRGDGSAGGAATATISLTGSQNVTAYAVSTGGTGGNGFNGSGSGDGGAGGVASGTTAAAYSTGAGAASAHVTQIGGAGGGSVNKGEDAEADEGQSLRLILSYADPSGPGGTITVPLGTVADVPPSAPVNGDTTSTVGVPAEAATGTYVGITAHAVDPGGDILTYSLTADSSGGGFEIDSSSGKVTVADGSKITGAAGSYTVTIQASDGNGETSQQAFTIAVEGAPPVIPAGQIFSVNENVQTVGQIAASDPGGGSLTYSLTGLDDDSLFTLSASGTLAFNSCFGYDGTDPFGVRGLHSYDVNVQVSNGTETATGDVTVRPLNSGPLSLTTPNSAGPAVTTYGSEEGDTIALGAGTQVIFGGGGNDTIKGGSGLDTIYAGTGKDTITASTGRTTIVSYTGRDHFIGGTGIDFFQYESMTDKLGGPDVIDNFRQSPLHPQLADQIVIDTSGGLSHPGGGTWLDKMSGLEITPSTSASTLFADGTLSFHLDAGNKTGLFWNSPTQSIELAQMTGINHMSASDVKII
jgi:hypothetical protein